MAKQKTLNLKEFKSLVKKLIKEEIQKEHDVSEPSKFYIVKVSQDSDEPYMGPACGKCGVEPGKYYDSHDEAKMDAEKLTGVNPVGFEVKNKSSMDESAPEGWEGTVRAMKKHGDKIDNPFALANSMKNKGEHPHYKDKGGKPEKKEEYKESTYQEPSAMNEAKSFKKKLVVLEYRKNAVDKILKEASWFDKLRGVVDPSREVDDPKHIRSNIEGALSKADRFSKEFSSKVLANTSAINSYHEAVSDALDKLSLLDGSVSSEGLKQEYEGKIINAAKTFYKIMRDEKERIETFIKQLTSDLQSKGLDKSFLTVDKKPPVPSFKVNTPKDVADSGMIDKVISGEKDVSSIK